MDFQVLPGTGDQRTTSPATPALRRAYVTVDKWLFGQEWTNFQVLSVLPETADYVGPTEGTIFNRQAQVRYTSGPVLALGREPGDHGHGLQLGARASSPTTTPCPTSRPAMPIVRPWGEVQVAGIVRQLAYETTGATAIDDSDPRLRHLRRRQDQGRRAGRPARSC